MMAADPAAARITRALYDALLNARPYVLEAVRQAERERWLPIEQYRRRLLDEIDGALADAQETL